MFTPAKIWAVTVDSKSGITLLIIKETNGSRKVPMWLGLLEASPIIYKLKGVEFARPMTHDLLVNFMDLLDVRVKKIEFTDIVENTCFTSIHISHKGKRIALDTRVGDASALSISFDVPILVSESVFTKSNQTDFQVESEDESEKDKKWYKILENLNPDDLGNT